MYQYLARRMKPFFEREIIKGHIQESGSLEKIENALDELPKKAQEYFKAQCYRLAVKSEKFYRWLNLQESEKEEIENWARLEGYAIETIEILNEQNKAMDIGFKLMEKAINDIPSEIELSKTNEVLKYLENRYAKTVEKSIIDDLDDPQKFLRYPKKSEIFIPQAFQVLPYTGGEKLEDKETWSNLPVRDDLSEFLLNYLDHPISVHTPLIILGEPGSGKSLLTSMLAARLIVPASSYTPIRVELRHSNPANSISVQISTQVNKDAEGQRTWEELAKGFFIDRPPLILFDGYDELLQATGKVFEGYLRLIEEFQKDQLLMRVRPVRTIVTSRISLIDKADVPEQATVIRLLDFTPEKQNQWIACWNKENSLYFNQNNVEPFVLPEGNASINKLAEQPLLLMMLAIYDSVNNPLHQAGDVDQSFLYNELLRRFIERELKKYKQYWKKTELKEAINREIERLGVAAIGMFNRRNLFINKEDLEADLKLFNLEETYLEKIGFKPSSVEGQYDLQHAERMFGSFFFQENINEVQEKENGGNYEFIHNTFGEFLTADFTLRKLLERTSEIHALKRNTSLKKILSQRAERIDEQEYSWFACLMYAPLFSRPVIIRLLREWAPQFAQLQKRDMQKVLTDFDTIVANHIKLLLTGDTLSDLIMKKDQFSFVRLPFIGYLAIYTLNLILVRTLLVPDGFAFDEEQYTSSKDGTRAWDRLTYLWRSWFSLEELSKLAAILIAERKDTKIHLKIREPFGSSLSSNGLSRVYDVGQALADNIFAGLSGFLLHDSFSADKIELDMISEMLYSEQLSEPLAIDLFTKQLRHLRRGTKISLAELDTISKDFKVGLSVGHMVDAWSSNLEASASALAEIARLAKKTDDSKFLRIYQSLIVGPVVLNRVDELAEEGINVARETDFSVALEYFKNRFMREKSKTSVKHSVTLLSELIKVSQERSSGDEIIWRYLKDEYLGTGRYIPAFLAVQMIKFAREMGDQAVINYFSQKYLKIVLQRKKYTNSALVMEMLKIARETGNQEAMSQLLEGYGNFVQVERASRQWDVLEMEPAALIIELFRTASEINSQQVPVFLIDYAHFIAESNSRYLSQSLITTIVKFARKTNHQRLIDGLSKNSLPAILQTQELVPVELAIELIKLAQGLPDYPQTDMESFYRKNITVERCHLESLPLDVIMDIRRLARKFSDNELVQRIDARLSPIGGGA